MGAIAMRIRARRARPAAQQMLDLIRRQGSGGAAFLPGMPLASGAHWLSVASSSPTPGLLGLDAVTRPTIPWHACYVESTASTPAAVDGPVGFLSDGEGTVGAELAPATVDFTTAAWYKGNGATAPSANVVNFPAVSAEVIQQGTGVNSANKSYFIRFTATGNGTLSVGVSNTVDQAVRQQFTLTATPQVFTCKVDLNGTNVANAALSFCRLAGDTCTQATITAASWKQLTGRHATQNSGPNKPTLRRGLVNLLTYSNDLTNVVWSKSGSITTGAVDPLGGTSGSAITASSTNTLVYNNLSNPINSAVYTGVMTLKAGVGSPWVVLILFTTASTNGCRAWFNLSTGAVGTVITNGSATNVSASITPAGNGYFQCQLSCIPNGSDTTLRLEMDFVPSDNNYSSTVGDTRLFYRAGLFQGTLTAAQILAAGGIPLTTTIAGSSSGGNYALEFGGSVTQLQASFAPTTAATVVLAVRVNSFAGTPVLVGQAAGGLQVYINSGGGVQAGIAGGTNFGSANGVITAGAVYVISVRIAVNGTSTIRVNGVVVATSTAITTAMNQTTISIGSNGSSNFTPGLFGPVLLYTSVLSDAETQVLERGVGALGPILGVKF